MLKRSLVMNLTALYLNTLYKVDSIASTSTVDFWISAPKYISSVQFSYLVMLFWSNNSAAFLIKLVANKTNKLLNFSDSLFSNLTINTTTNITNYIWIIRTPLNDAVIINWSFKKKFKVKIISFQKLPSPPDYSKNSNISKMYTLILPEENGVFQLLLPKYEKSMSTRHSILSLIFWFVSLAKYSLFLMCKLQTDIVSKKRIADYFRIIVCFFFYFLFHLF